MNCDEDRHNYYISKREITMKMEKLTNLGKEEKNIRKYSEPLYIRGVQWKILATIREFGQSKEKIFGYFIQCNGENNDSTWSCKASAVLKILAQKEGKDDHICSPISHIFDAKENDWGFEKFMKFEDLIKEDSSYYDKSTDSIILRAEIEVELPRGIDFSMDCEFHNEIGQLFDFRNKFSDCTLIASDGKEFKVYKGILACRSPVFAAMFESEMAEKSSNIVKIKDINGEILEELLRFIYTGRAPKLEETAVELMMAAEKYQVSRLKNLAEQKLIQVLEKENACEFLILADLHCAKNLMTLAIEFIQKHVKETMETDGWKLMVKEKHAHLIEQILKAIVANK